MKLKLLKVLTEEIEEQGYGRYYTDVVLSSGVKIGDTRGYNFLSGNSINKSDKVITKVLSNSEDVFSSTIGTLDTTPLEKELGNVFKVPTNKGGTYGWRNRICRSDLKNKKRYNYKHWHAGRDYSGMGTKWVITLKDGVIDAKDSMCFTIKYTDGNKGRFCHMTNVGNVGDKLFAGEIVGMIGDVGSAGHVHLHWEYYPGEGGYKNHFVPPLKAKYTQLKSCDNANVNLSNSDVNYYINQTLVKSISDVMTVGGAATEKENYDKVYIRRTDIDPNGYEKNYIKYITSDITKKSYDEVLKKCRNVLKVSTKDEEVIKKDEKLIDTRLPKNIQDLMDKLKSKWGVVITQSHIDKEYEMEGNVRPDAGSVNKTAENKIKELIKDCKTAYPNVNYPADIKSGYRNYDTQVDNFGKKVKNDGRSIENVQASNCLPGFTQHHTGRAFDIFSVDTSWWDKNSKVKEWVADNCKNYGFEVTYTKPNKLRIPEPWHLYYK
jgi:D-alanyl-D-alanine carboxypeptidase